MKKIGKILSLCVIIFLLAAAPAFSQNLLENLQAQAEEFSMEIAKALPFNSTMGLNWSDAHIGLLFPSFPPRLGIGITAGTTFINIASINDLLEMFGVDPLPVNVNIGLPLPGYTAEARVGGIFLPFDVGFKIGYLSLENFPLVERLGIGLDYLLIGADLRYSLLPVAVPIVKLSVGVGVNRLEGGISKTIGTGLPTFEFNDPENDTSYTLAIDDPVIGLRWKTTCVELKAQASFNLTIITPYVGLGLSYAWSEAGYHMLSQIKVNDEPISDVAEDIIEIMNALGLNNITEDGFESMFENNTINFRAFGGFSINLPFIRFDLTAMYNFMSQNFGGTFGVRFQL
jgi:hypothetical protein